MVEEIVMRAVQLQQQPEQNRKVCLKAYVKQCIIRVGQYLMKAR